ncbi:hypothetical protein KDD17_13070 [Sulfitobacter albidus]|uniref:DUF2268 domain-containing protein n=1 Tax=Sulfitobacter albidus TaxID=2829501 RepID=A0A975JCB6_9RHOB|nr:DUF2268 domain-containing putative Zn-dependent protease [Sulfitobacter albidus]QUJ75862.1 hypothetical protein KDD17_13070 [Sulfitobacter albidus]
MQTDWTLHWLEALRPFSTDQQSAISRAVDAAHASLAAQMPPPRLDMLIAARSPDWVIDGMGLSGMAYLDKLMAMNCDPTSPDLLRSCETGAFSRQVLHEVNHCLRMTGPGYGRTLGEAMVSEGLAGHFVIHLMQSAPERWEQPFPPEERAALLPDAATLNAPGYDHAAWFFGTGDLPHWAGYRLGFALVADWWAQHPTRALDALIHTPAADVLAVQGM